MPALFLRLQQVIGTALILGFFSEYFFMNEGPVARILAGFTENPVTALIGFGELAAYYGLFAYPMLIAIGYFRVSNWSGLILAASLYGLAAEALVVPVVYEGIPYSIVWTSLSWHTLIDVYLGWFIMRRALRARSIWPGAMTMVLAGIGWGIWATWYWADAPNLILTQGEFAAYSALTSLALLLGIILADRAPVTTFRATKLEITLVALISAALFGLMGFAFIPLPALILAVVAGILWALQKNKGGEITGYLTPLDTPPNPWRYSLIALLPITAIGTYTIVLETKFTLQTEDTVLLLLAMGAGTFLTALSTSFWPRRK